MIKVILKLLTIFFLLIVGFFKSQSQTLPALSPLSEVKDKIGYTNVKIEYSRPSVKGRQIFGDLVPMNKVWRAGANDDTKVTFSTDVKINNKTLKKGTYSIFIKPKQNTWVIYFYQKDSSDIGGVPPQDKDVAHAWKAEKLKLKYETPIKITEHTETLTIGIQDIKLNKGKLFIAWDNIKAIVPFSTNAVETAISQIENRFKEPAGFSQYLYADFYQANNIELEKALKYINKAIELEQSSWWFLRCKSQILAKLKKYDEAIKTAKKGLEIAEKEGSNFYITQSKNDIKRWTNI